MSEVVVVVSFRAKPERVEDLEEAIRAAALPTHGEEGCVRYALHRALDDPALMILIERWRSPEELAAHGAQPWVETLRAQGHLMAQPPVLNFLEPRPFGDAVKGAL